MSANNWKQCPVCLVLANHRKVEAEQKAASAYGKVPAREYDALLAQARTMPEVPEHFREDWEIGISRGGKPFSWKVSYSGFCGDCGFEVQFAHTMPLDSQVEEYARKRVAKG